MFGIILDIMSVLLMLCIIPTAWLVYKKKITFFNGVFLGTFLFLMSFGCSVYSTYILHGYSPIDYTVNNAFDQFVETYQSVPDITPDELSQLKGTIDVVRDVYFMLLPTIVIISNLLWSYLLLMLSKGVFALFGRDVSGFNKFSELKIPKTAVFLGVAAYIVSMFFKEQQIGYAFVNFSSIIFAVSSVCGLSVIDYALRKKVKYSIVRILIYLAVTTVLTLFGGVGAGILTLVGMLDSVYDFRKFDVKTDEKL